MYHWGAPTSKPLWCNQSASEHDPQGMHPLSVVWQVDDLSKSSKWFTKLIPTGWGFGFLVEVSFLTAAPLPRLWLLLEGY